MKILYSKKRRKYDLFYIIFCLLIGMLSLFLSETNHMFIYLYMPLGLISLYRYIKVKYYLTIENNIIRQVEFVLHFKKVSTRYNFTRSYFKRMGKNI